MQSVVHFEVPYDDLDRAKKFYEEAFGWQMPDWPIEDGSVYTGAMTTEIGDDNKPLEKGAINGGMVPRSVASTPLLVLRVDNAEEAAQKAIEAGGKRVSEHSYVNVGKAIYINDTEGNLVGLWEDNKKK